MPNRITNIDGSRIGYLSFDLSDGEISPVVILRIIPSTGFELSAATDADVELQARENGSGDPWTDLATGIDLSSYPPETPVSFDVRAVAGSPLVDVRRVALRLQVSSQGSAAW